MATAIILLGPGDEEVLTKVEADVFDGPVQLRFVAEFLTDPRHHLAVAVKSDTVIGFASAVHYVHPDKAPELWINEVGVAPAHRHRGLGKKLLQSLFRLGENLGCREAWVLTDRSNAPAQRLYASVGGEKPDEEPILFEFRLDKLEADVSSYA